MSEGEESEPGQRYYNLMDDEADFILGCARSGLLIALEIYVEEGHPPALLFTFTGQEQAVDFFKLYFNFLETKKPKPDS